MAPIPFAPSHQETVFPGAQDEKRHQHETGLPQPVSTSNQKRKMATSKRVFIAVLLGMLVSLTLALAPRMNCLQHRASTEESSEELHKLLHDHLPQKFKDGVYPTDEEAVDALHDDHAEIATSIVQLARRQNTNSTSDDPTVTNTSGDDPGPTDEPTNTPDEPTVTRSTTTTSTRSTPTTPKPTPTADDDEPEPTKKSSTKSRSSTVKTHTSTLPGGDVTIVTSTSFYDVLPEPTGGANDPDLQDAAPRAAVAAMPALLVAIVGGLLML